MESTIQQNNISTNVSINIATFASNIQSALQTSKQRVLKSLTLPRLYRMELRMIYRISSWMENHTKLTNLCLAALYVALIFRVLMCL